jgi:PAS domain S-box-containing protein
MADTRDQGRILDPPPREDMRARIEAFDWAATPLGPRQRWSASLRFAVDMVVASRFPTALRWGRDLVLIYNDAYAPMLGERHPKVLGKTFAEAPPTSAADSEAPERAILDGTSGGEVIEDLPLPTVHAGGTVTYGYFTLRLTPLPDPAAPSGVGGVLIALSETTERKHIEAALEAAEADRRIAIDAAGLGRWDHNPATGERYWDKRCREIYGLPEGVIDDPRDAFERLVHPDDLPALMEAVRVAMDPAGDNTINREYRIRRGTDGALRWIETFGRAFFRDGQCVRLVGVASDVTERKAAAARLALQEETMALAVDAANVGTWDFDPRDRKLVVSDRGYGMFGMLPGSAAGPEDFYARMHPEDRARVGAVLRDSMDPAVRGPVEVEFRALGRDDAVERWIAAKGRSLFDEAGACVRVVGATVDITERKKSELHLRLLVNELNHRVKNTLATIQAIAVQTFHAARSLPQAQEAFSARIVALAEAHDILTRENWEGAELSDVLARLETLHGGTGRFVASGPPVRLSPRLALSLSMALHELATNAAKYGALSIPAGHVRVSWVVTSPKDDGERARLALTWREHDGPPVSPPSRRGFGSRLIERGLAAELSGEAQIDFRPEGVVCRIEAGLEG